MNSLLFPTVLATGLLPANSSPAFPWWSIGWSAFNLALIAAVIWYFGRHKFREFFAARHEQIKSDIQNSAGRLKEAEVAKAQAEADLAGLDQKVASCRAKLNEEIKAIHVHEEEQLELLKKLLDKEYDERLLAEKIALNHQLFAEFLESLFAEAKEQIKAQNSQEVHEQLLNNLLKELNDSTGQEIAGAVKGEF